VALALWRGRIFSAKLVVPIALLGASTAAAALYYNHRVTGDALELPYAAYFREYRIAPPWLFLRERAAPEYRHASLENSWRNDSEKFQRIKGHPDQNLADFRVTAGFYVSALSLFIMLVGVAGSRDRRVWTAAAICGVLSATLLIEYAKTPHYVAGGIGLLGVLIAAGLRQIRRVWPERGPTVVLILVLALCIQGRASDDGESWQVRLHHTSPHALAAKQLSGHGGRHLLFVRYAPDHYDRVNEVIFNPADIDASDIVFAHDMGERKNRELIDYYRGERTAWLVEPDRNPAALIPYEAPRYAASAGRTYVTDFGLSSAFDPTAWTMGSSPVRFLHGTAIGTQSGRKPPPYTDSGAVLSGKWGSDQFVQIKVKWNGAAQTSVDYDEVEIRLRGTIRENWDRTYNINCRVGAAPADSYIQMGRANGPPDDFEPLAGLTGPRAACGDGDVISARIVGDTITVFINARQVLQASDAMIVSGAPGLGFFHQGAGRNEDFGISNFEASDVVN
jgi:hypothetical protein